MEIKTPPIVITINGVELHAFSEEHSGADIARYLIDQLDYDDAVYVVTNELGYEDDDDGDPEGTDEQERSGYGTLRRPRR